MDELAIRDISLFFFFCLLDEEKAYEFSSRAVDEYFELKRKFPSEKVQVLVVKATFKIWKKFWQKKISAWASAYDETSGMELAS